MSSSLRVQLIYMQILGSLRHHASTKVSVYSCVIMPLHRCSPHTVHNAPHGSGRRNASVVGWFVLPYLDRFILFSLLPLTGFTLYRFWSWCAPLGFVLDFPFIFSAIIIVIALTFATVRGQHPPVLYPRCGQSLWIFSCRVFCLLFILSPYVSLFRRCGRFVLLIIEIWWNMLAHEGWYLYA